MATIITQTIIDRAETIIQDTTNVRWPAAELLNWLNDGQREIVLLKPEASVVNASVQLTAAKTKQTLPAAAITLLDVTRNMGSNGTTDGDAIRLVSREVLDAQSPDWHTHTNTGGKIQHYVFDPRDPKTFYVYPKAPATAWYVELVYSASPTEITNPATAISIDDIYANALLDYVLYRAYSKDAEYAGNAQRAVGHYQAFVGSITGKTQSDLARNPNLVVGGFNPNVIGAAKV